MHIRFLGHGTGSARAAADYLVGERDAAGRVRPGIEILRGNPDHVAAVADPLEFGRRYTSVVIAWAPEDRATRRSAPSSTSSSRRRGRDWSRTATPGPRSRTGSTAPGSTCTSSPPAATWRRAAASTSRRPAGRRPSARCATPSTTSTAGAARTTRRAPGRTSPAIAPTSRRRSCGPASSTKRARAS